MKFLKLLFVFALIGFILSSNISYAAMEDADDVKRLIIIAEIFKGHLNKLRAVSPVLEDRSDMDEAIKALVDSDVSTADFYTSKLDDIVELRRLFHKMETTHDKSLVMELIRWRIDMVKFYCTLRITTINPNDNLEESFKKINARQFSALSELHLANKARVEYCKDAFGLFSKY